MANALTPKVRGIKTSVKATIIQDMVNTKNKINSLPLSVDPKPFNAVLNKLSTKLILLSEKAITDLNDDPRLDDIVSGLDAAAKEAKKTANSLKNLSKKISDFAAMVGKIETIVGKIISLAV